MISMKEQQTHSAFEFQATLKPTMMLKQGKKFMTQLGFASYFSLISLMIYFDPNFSTRCTL